MARKYTNDMHKQLSAVMRFLGVCLLFAIPVAIALGIGEWLMRTRVPNPFQFKHTRLSENSADIKTLVLGSSHTYYGISPKELGDSAFNLASISQIFHYDWLLLSGYEFPNLRTVILPVSYFSFFDHEFEETESWGLVVNYKVYMDINTHSDFSKYNFELSRPEIYTKKLRALVFSKPLSCDSLGFGLDYGLSKRSQRWEDTWMRTVSGHTAIDWDAVPGHVDYLGRIAEYCKDRGVRLVLITTPTWHKYYEHLDDAQLERTYELVDSFSEKYELVYLDYLKDGRFNKDDFYDTDHLSTEGALKFSKILRKDLKL